MANFKVGDEVICVDALHREDFGVDIDCGKKYVVGYLSEEDGCVGLVGVIADYPSDSCEFCGTRNPLQCWDTWRFIKLDGLNEPEAEFVGTNLPALVE